MSSRWVGRVVPAVFVCVAACAEGPESEPVRHGEVEKALAPGNDEIAGALELGCGTSVSGSTVEATRDLVDDCGTNISTNGVWYHFVGDGSAVTLSMCGPTTNYDSKLSVYSGSPGALSCVGGNDDSGVCGLSSIVTFCSTAGTDYWVLVHGYADSTGEFELSASCVDVDAGGSDSACGAPTLAMGQTASFNNLCATAEPGEVAPPAGSDFGCDAQDGWCAFETEVQSSVWFELSVPARRSVSIETTWGFDTQIAVWQVNGCGDLTDGSASLVAANDDGGEVYASKIEAMYCLDPDFSYFLQIDGYSSQRGEADVTVTPVDRTVTICHSGKTQLVDGCALAEHLAHGDTRGACPAGCKPKEKAEICHDPSGKQPHTISVSSCAVPAHLGHGDYAGACGTSCTPEQIMDCSGVCLDMEVAGGMFGNGICDEALNCEMFGFDGYDCLVDPPPPPGECYPSQVIDCFGGCTEASWIGDGVCDLSLDCEAFGFDGGDCSGEPPPPPPPPGECSEPFILGCDGASCLPPEWVGDAFCDDVLNCETYGFDGGDCAP